MTLCRCGHSQMKPLCDGTHREIDFREQSETAAAAVGLARDALGVRVHADAVVADEAAERDPLRLASSIARLDGAPTPTRIGQPGKRRLLDELERETPAEAEDRVAERQQAGAERPADDLVERVVPADVLAHADEPRRRGRTVPTRAARR